MLAKENFGSCSLEALKFPFNLPFISLLITFAWRRLVFTFALSMLVFAHWRVLSVLDSCQSFQTSDSSPLLASAVVFSPPVCFFFYFLSRDCLLGSGDEWECILGLGSHLSLGLGLLLALVGDQ